ncbi:hypothetical protein M901_2820, partial [Bacteriovorax sp. DB6_IX]
MFLSIKVIHNYLCHFLSKSSMICFAAFLCSLK